MCSSDLECAAAAGASVVVHSCASDLPWEMLRRSAVHAVSVDVSTLGAGDLDGIGEFVDAGRTVLLGVVPVVAPTSRPTVREIAAAAASVTDRLGFARTVLTERIGVTPACGLAGATPEWARAAVELTQKTADALHQDPEDV